MIKKYSLLLGAVLVAVIFSYSTGSLSTKKTTSATGDSQSGSPTPSPSEPNDSPEPANQAETAAPSGQSTLGKTTSQPTASSKAVVQADPETPIDEGPYNETSQISFSGFDWVITSSTQSTIGPGGNYFSKGSRNIWVDSSGFLHMRISKSQGKWYCTQMVLPVSHGYGKYSVEIENSKNLAPSVVFGFFTFDHQAEDQYYREIDLELSRWNNPGVPNFQTVVQPNSDSQRIRRYSIPTNQPTRHIISWRQDSVSFESYAGSSQINAWTYSEGSIPTPGNEKLILNFWLAKAVAPAGVSGEPEIVIRSVNYEP